MTPPRWIPAATTALPERVPPLTATPPPPPAPAAVSLTTWATLHTEALRDMSATQRIGVDRRVWANAEGTATIGDPVDIGPACVALLQAASAAGDDASGCLGRLIVQGIPRFQICEEQSQQWGAFANHLYVANGISTFPDQTAISVRAHARTTTALFAAQKLWGSETRQRSALAAARWLILRQGADGLPCGETIGPDNTSDAPCSPWTALEAACALAEAHRNSRIAVFQTAARRMVESVEQGMDKNQWNVGDWSPLAVGDAVDALLEFAAVADNIRWNRLACRIADLICRAEVEPCDWKHHAGAAAAWIATARIHEPEVRLGNALEHLGALAADSSMPWTPANHARVIRLVESFFLRLAGLIPEAKVCTATRTVHVNGCRFDADPAAHDHVRVESCDGKPLETRLWACSKTFRVLGAVLLPEGGNSITVLRRGRPVATRCLRTGQVVATMVSHPFSDTKDARFVLFSTV